MLENREYLKTVISYIRVINLFPNDCFMLLVPQIVIFSILYNFSYHFSAYTLITEKKGKNWGIKGKLGLFPFSNSINVYFFNLLYGALCDESM